MKKYLLFTFLIFQFASSQVKQVIGNLFDASLYSKEISLFKGKSFVIKEVFGESKSIIKFELDPLSASSSGELTTLIYNCEELKKEGIVFGFYGDYWNEYGVVYKGYAFKNLEKKQALEFLQKLEDAKTEYNKYLSEDLDNNNVYFTYDDITILMYKTDRIKFRVFWKTFDAEWGDMSFSRTKLRFEKKI